MLKFIEKHMQKKEVFIMVLALVVVLTIALTVSLTSCDIGGVDKDEVEVYDEDKNEITITLPAYIFEGEEDFDPQVLIDEHGYTDVVVHEDGSVSLIMTKDKHFELMQSLKKDFQEEFAAMVNAEDTPFIKNITTNEDFSEIIVDIEKEAHQSAFFDIIPGVLGHAASIYQQYNGDEPHYQIIFQDVETGELLSSVVYPDPDDETQVEEETEAESADGEEAEQESAETEAAE